MTVTSEIIVLSGINAKKNSFEILPNRQHHHFFIFRNALSQFIFLLQNFLRLLYTIQFLSPVMIRSKNGSFWWRLRSESQTRRHKFLSVIIWGTHISSFESEFDKFNLSSVVIRRCASIDAYIVSFSASTVLPEPGASFISKLSDRNFENLFRHWHTVNTISPFFFSVIEK